MCLCAYWKAGSKSPTTLVLVIASSFVGFGCHVQKKKIHTIRKIFLKKCHECKRERTSGRKRQKEVED